MESQPPPAGRPRRVVIVGGGASGALVAVQLLHRTPAGLEVVAIEPREALGRGVAFGTPDPWHRLNVPAIAMSALPEDPDHFCRWADVDPVSFPDRQTFGRYLGALLADAANASAGTLRHVRARAERLAAGPDPSRAPAVLAGDERIEADVVVLATGNELPPVPPFLAALAASDDPRFVRDPWGAGALDPVRDGETVAIVGTGHTALDLAASLIRGRTGVRVVALSRHGELPRTHEDPWRPRPAEPVFGVEAFRAFGDPLEEARARIRAHEGGWRQGLDSLRPISGELWRAMDEARRLRFARGWRREWEIHRSRISAGVAGDVDRWVRGGRLAVHAAGIDRIVPHGRGLRIDVGERAWVTDHVLLATGPDESPSASPFLASAMAAGIARPGFADLGIDVDPDTLRVIDAAGSTARPVFALGPVIRGALFETIAIPEIRGQAAAIASRILADGP